jgi:hypothetical protein
MRATIFTLLFCMTAIGAFAQNTAESRPWQQGTVQSLQFWHGLETELKIVGADNILYTTALEAYRLHPADMIPGVGIVSILRRRKKVHLNLAVGSTVKFAVSAQHGWLLDADGIEQKLIVYSASLAKP